MSKESTLGRIIGRIRENTPRARAEREIREAWKSNRPIYEKAEEAKKHILTISLQDYASSQGKSPSDYLMQQLSSHSQDYNEEWCIAVSLGKMLDKMEAGGFEAVVDSRLNISHDHSWNRVGGPIDVTATGTALKLKVK